MSEQLYVIDAFSCIFQVFYAIRQPMTGAKGQPTNAVFGFTGDLRHLLNDIKPEYLICAMDSPGEGVRNEIYTEYKANRDEMPDDLRPQIDAIVEIVEGYNIPVIRFDGWEADDVIATVTRQAVEKGLDVRIVTNDKDARQLIGPQVQLYNIRKKTYSDEAFLEKEWGIRPDQVIDFQALVGDSVDNVPGVPLIGPKKASGLLQQFDTLDEVLANPDKAKGAKLQQNLKDFADQALLSRELVTLKQDLPIEIDWDHARVSEANYERLYDLFTEAAFLRYAEIARDKLAESKIEETHERAWETIDSADKFQKFLAELKQQKSFCVDLETTSKDAMRAEIVGWAICWKDDYAYYLPVEGPTSQTTLKPADVLAALKPLLEDDKVEIVNQNIKYDMLVLRRAGVELRGISMDPMIGDYLLDAGARAHNLDRLAKRYLFRRTIPISDLIGKGKQQKKMFEVDISDAAEYATEDADIAWQVSNAIAKEMKEEGLWDLYWDLERPLISVLADMEYRGVRVDAEELKRQSDELAIRLDALMAEIHDIAGHPFNIDSPKQLAQVLFDELDLPVIKRTKTGASTNQEVLERLAEQHELPAKIIEHRHLSKLKGTYLDALPQLVHPETKNIHASFNQVVAATGRLSSSDPNLQNIPIRTEEGRRVRQAFVASEPDWKLVCADYSQIELRMLAHFSGDPALQQAFQEGADIHTAVASEVFGVAENDVDSEMRRVAKAVNFGVIYGQTPWGLAAALDISKEEAAAFIEGYFNRYSKVQDYLDEILAEAASSGYSKTILDRRRAVSGIRTTRRRQLNMSERTAINTVIQGSAADLIKKAMIAIHDRIIAEKHPGRMLLQIHDELVFEAPEDACDSLIELVKHEMETALEVDVPLVVDIAVGDNWLEAK